MVRKTSWLCMSIAFPKASISAEVTNDPYGGELNFSKEIVRYLRDCDEGPQIKNLKDGGTIDLRGTFRDFLEEVFENQTLPELLEMLRQDLHASGDFKKEKELDSDAPAGDAITGKKLQEKYSVDTGTILAYMKEGMQAKEPRSGKPVSNQDSLGPEESRVLTLIEMARSRGQDPGTICSDPERQAIYHKLRRAHYIRFKLPDYGTDRDFLNDQVGGFLFSKKDFLGYHISVDNDQCKTPSQNLVDTDDLILQHGTAAQELYNAMALKLKGLGKTITHASKEERMEAAISSFDIEPEKYSPLRREQINVSGPYEDDEKQSRKTIGTIIMLANIPTLPNNYQANYNQFKKIEKSQ